MSLENNIIKHYRPNERSIYTDNFLQDVKQGRVFEPLDIALGTLHIIKGNLKGNCTQNLLKSVQDKGNYLAQELPKFEIVVQNIVCRVLRLIQDEYDIGCKKWTENTDPQESLFNMITFQEMEKDYSNQVPELQSAVLANVEELAVELEESNRNIIRQALQHIHTGEVIMTVGQSSIVEAFLKDAAKERTFQVIVAGCAPLFHGYDMAASLGSANIQTTLISDSAVFALMARVNKVIIGTHAVMANGGLKAVCGSYAMALAAQYYSVPLLVLSPSYMLTPCYRLPDNFNNCISPSDVFDCSNGALQSKVRVLNPLFDYVPPELVSLFISNNGGHTPSYIYRNLAELYRSRDYK